MNNKEIKHYLNRWKILHEDSRISMCNFSQYNISVHRNLSQLGRPLDLFIVNRLFIERLRSFHMFYLKIVSFLSFPRVLILGR